MDLKDKAIKVCRMFQYVVKELVSDDWLLPSFSPVVIETGLMEFSTLFPGGLSDGRIVDFVVYQIYRYRDMIGLKGTRWNISWCFSKAAIGKFKAQFLDVQGKSGMMYYIDQWLGDAEINRTKLEDMLVDTNEHHLAKFIYVKSEDSIKSRFPDMDMRLRICLSSTTAWTPRSTVCSSCVNYQKCMELSKKKYPELVRLRQEEYGR